MARGGRRLLSSAAPAPPAQPAKSAAAVATTQNVAVAVSVARADSAAAAPAGPVAARAVDSKLVAAALAQRYRLVGGGALGWAAPRFEVEPREAALAERALGLRRGAVADAAAACSAVLAEAAPRVRGLPRALAGALVALGGLAVFFFAPKSEVDEQAGSEALPRNASVGMAIIVGGVMLSALLYLQLRRGMAAAVGHVRRLLSSDALQDAFAQRELRILLIEPAGAAASPLAVRLAVVAAQRATPPAPRAPPAAAATAAAAAGRSGGAAVTKQEGEAASNASPSAVLALDAPTPAAAPATAPAPPAAEPKAPVRPPTAYQGYLADFKRTDEFAALLGPGAGTAARLQAVAERWGAMADDERRPWAERAAQQLAQYRAENEAFAAWSVARAAELEAAAARAGKARAKR